MNHDVIYDRYARLYDVPDQLRQYGQVRGFCIDYRITRRGDVPADLRDIWQISSVPGTLFIGWIYALLRAVQQFRPDVIIASSDCLQVVLGWMLARLVGARFVADLYDDYATFGLARIPGMKWLYRKALAAADGITAVSVTLAEDLEEEYPQTPVLVLESTINPTAFAPRDKAQSRIGLGLDDLNGKQLVGLCGGLNAFHGVDTVFAAVPQLAQDLPNAVLVIAGRSTPDFPLPEGDNVRYLGMLPHERMAEFFSAMDVMIVALSDTPFGYYAFPQKAYEVIACQVPAVVAEVGALARLFDRLHQARYQPGRPETLVEVLKIQLSEQTVLDVPVPSWADQARLLHQFVNQ